MANGRCSLLGPPSGWRALETREAIRRGQSPGISSESSGRDAAARSDGVVWGGKERAKGTRRREEKEERRRGGEEGIGLMLTSSSDAPPKGLHPGGDGVACRLGVLESPVVARPRHGLGLLYGVKRRLGVAELRLKPLNRGDLD